MKGVAGDLQKANNQKVNFLLFVLYFHLQLFFFFFSTFSQQVLILVDDYDDSVNGMIGNPAFDKWLTDNKGDKRGPINIFFGHIKHWCEKGHFAFITGIYPISLDSYTSGFNISYDLYEDSEYDEMFGFSHRDVTKLVTIANEKLTQKSNSKYTLSPKDQEDLLVQFRNLHNGYFFSDEQKHGLFNPECIVESLKKIAKPVHRGNWKKIVNNSKRFSK